MEIDMPKELKKLMKNNDFIVHRAKNHIIWRHRSGARVVTPASPSDWRSLKNIKRDIKKEVGVVYD